MSVKFYLPKSEGKRIPWLSNFVAKLKKYAAKYGITTEEVETAEKNSTAYAFWVDQINKQNDHLKSLYAFKENLANGEIKPITAPETLIIPTSPPFTNGGIFKQVPYVVNRIKGNINYAYEDGLDMGIEGVEISTKDVTEIKPVLKLRIGTEGYVEVLWKKGDHEGIQLEKNNGNGWQMMAIDLSPNYIDHSPLPEEGKSEIRRYRGIYIENSVPIGSYSAVEEIAVKG